MDGFVTLDDIQALTGRTFESSNLARVQSLIPLVSDLIRSEGAKVGVDVDERIDMEPGYESVVKLITCDVIARAMRQATTGEPMSQESQSALGYTWSGTYAIPGGGVAMSLMNNERKMLGFRKQRYGVMEIWDGSQEGL